MGEPKDQETRTPSHGYDAVEREGVRVDVKESHGQEAEAESNLLRRLRQVMASTDLIGSQKLILSVILSELKDDASCSLTHERIADCASLSRRLVAQHVPLLVEAGWIKIERKSNNYMYSFVKE